MGVSGTVENNKWTELSNLGDGSCGIYSVLQAYLIIQGVWPQDAEAAFSSTMTPAIRQLVRLCRTATVEALSNTLDPDVVAGSETVAGGALVANNRASDTEDLRTRDTWVETILADNSWYDFRAVVLLEDCFGIKSHVQMVRKIVDGRCVKLVDVDGHSTPVRANVLILWGHHGQHFSVLVRKGSFVFHK